MAKIVYKPHCSNCGCLIIDVVYVSKVQVKTPDIELLNSEVKQINPIRCSCCGEVFTEAEFMSPKEYEG